MPADYRLFIQESRGNRPLDYSAPSASTFCASFPLSEGFSRAIFSYELLGRFRRPRSHRPRSCDFEWRVSRNRDRLPAFF